MADFKTALGALGRDEVHFDSIAINVAKMLARHPELAASIMDQLREAYGEEIIDADLFARLRRVVDNPQQYVGAGHTANDLDDTASPDTEALAAQVRASLSTDKTPDAQIDFDITGDSTDIEHGDAQTSASRATETAWADVPIDAAGQTIIQPTSVLKDRFKLDEVLGVGGMGTVYRGRDLIKVEARDKNPYVALKVLNEDFKQHPDSFIALQREASRQQRLAHPNIATVYDFDRTRGGTVFITMELLEGEPLNKLIKKKIRPQGGLAFDEAFPMIEGLGNALIYAHEHGIVHSDFKPGNCFKTKDGVMKVLDFGIARAVKNPGQADGEKTLFDPAKFGALTPAYASAEMLEGEEPDPRDDLYALACVAYELLSGKHPFNKLPANTARDNGLVPKPIKGLKRRQMRALLRGLAFARADRSQSVAEFLQQLEGSTPALSNPWITIPTALIAIAVLAIPPILDFIHDREIQDTIDRMRGGDRATIAQVLETVNTEDFDPADRDIILVSTRREVLDYYQKLIAERVDVAAERYDFDGARQIIGELAAMRVFRDSAQLQQWREAIDNQESRLLNEQTAVFNEALVANRLLPLDDTEDIHDALAIIRRLAAKKANALERLLPGQFSAAIERAVVNEEFALGEQLVAAAHKLLPQDTSLINLADKVTLAARRAERDRAVAPHAAVVRHALEDVFDLRSLPALIDDIENIYRLEPKHPLLQTVRQHLEPIVARELERVSGDASATASEIARHDLSGLLQATQLPSQATRARQVYFSFQQALREDLVRISLAIASDQLDRAAASPNVLALLASLRQRAPEQAITKLAHGMAARAFLVAARRRRAQGAEEVATSLFERAIELAPESAIAATARTESQAPAADRAADASAEFEAGLTALQAAIAANAEQAALSLDDLLTQYDTLSARRAIDPRLTTARDQIVELISKHSQGHATAGRYEQALQVIEKTLRFIPRAEPLARSLLDVHAARFDARQAAEEQALAASKRQIESSIDTPTAADEWLDETARNMSWVIGLSAADDPWIDEFAAKLTNRYLAEVRKMRDAERFARAEVFLAHAEYFGQEPKVLARERRELFVARNASDIALREQDRIAIVEGLKLDFETQLKANDLSAAAVTLDILRKSAAADDVFTNRDGPALLASTYRGLAEKQARQGDFAGALDIASTGLEQLPDDTALQAAVADYTIDGNRQALTELLTQANTPDLAVIFDKIAEIKSLDMDAFRDGMAEWVPLIVPHLETLRTTNPTQAPELYARARALFTDDPRILALSDPERIARDAPPATAEIRTALAAGRLTAAQSLLKELPAADASHLAVLQLAAKLRTRIDDSLTSYGAYQQHFNAQRYAAASDELDQALALWGDNTTFQAEKARVLAAIAQDRSSSSSKRAAYTGASRSPCAPKLAGYGKRQQGVCFDMVAESVSGPIMVVVPANEQFPQPYAIGKYELTIGDFNNYCGVSGECEPITGRPNEFPVTGISLRQATAYTQWLSTRTGHRYRLPSEQEWQYAAAANGQQPRPDYNCRVMQGEEILKGQSVLAVDSGKSNGWGLYNYVGNAREWVHGARGLLARGGSFQEHYGNCQISLVETHTGEPDPATGMRVLREIE